ncbi:hypothetical protein QUF50_01245 [Thiotrichales bacterium HSG1]|nr:hypothetical protein [Thiotrichales bacterium HSG1]
MFYKIMEYSILILLLLALSGCKISNISNLRKLIDFSEGDSNKPCIVGVWPAVKSGNAKYKMNQRRASKFVRDVRAAIRFGNKYRYKTALGGKNIPKSCKKLLWHSGSTVPGSYLSCMVTWGKKTIKKDKSCSGKFVIGSAITSSNGKAKILVVNLKKPKKYANKRNRFATGKDLNRLARDIGKKIKKVLR